MAASGQKRTKRRPQPRIENVPEARSSASTCSTMISGRAASSTTAWARVPNATATARTTSTWLRIVGRSTATAIAHAASMKKSRKAFSVMTCPL